MKWINCNFCFYFTWKQPEECFWGLSYSNCLFLPFEKSYFEGSPQFDSFVFLRCIIQSNQPTIRLLGNNSYIYKKNTLLHQYNLITTEALSFTISITLLLLNSFASLLLKYLSSVLLFLFISHYTIAKNFSLILDSWIWLMLFMNHSQTSTDCTFSCSLIHKGLQNQVA